MRRTVGLVLVGLGIFLLVLAPVLKWYVYPELAKLPQDQNSGSVATGVGTYYDPAAGEIKGANLVATRSVRGDVPASIKAGDDTAVWDTFTRIERLEDSHLVNARPDRVAMDRRTALAKNCCASAPDRKGLTYTFPIGTEKKTYPYYDTSLAKDFPAKYVSTESLKGLSVYHFKVTIEAQQLGAPRTVPGALVGDPGKPSVSATVYYASTRDIWVEPTSGVIVKGSDQVLQTLRTDGAEDKATLLSVTLVFDDKTQTKQADTASESRTQLNMLSLYGPLLCLLLGVLLLIGGLLLRRSGTTPPGGRRRANADTSHLQSA